MKINVTTIRLWLLASKCSSFMLRPHFQFSPFKNVDKIKVETKRLVTTDQSEDALPSSKLEPTTIPSVSLAPRLDGLDKPTVWHEMSPLAMEYGAVNLGQGFPDWDPPDFVVEAMAISTNPKAGRKANQYARSYAHMPLANILAEEYSKKLSRNIDPATEVATTVGCTNAIYCALNGLLATSDEVIMMEPAFDLYIAQTKLADGVPKFVPLRTKEKDVNEDGNQSLSANDSFYLDFDELEATISQKTKVLILNTPHNPTGKIFNREELEKLREIILKYPQITVITDEVYEHIIFDEKNSPHLHFASLPDMYERTLTLSSSGKTFSATGWKVGWAIGPPHLVRAVTGIQQWVNFSVATPNQDAIALCLKKAREPYKGYNTYYDWLADEYRRKRDLLVDILKMAGMTPYVPDGGFFIMADTSKINFPYDPTEVSEAMPCSPMPRDWSMSRWMTKTMGVTAIPPSAFYDVEKVKLAENMLRFAYCKSDDTIFEAHNRFDKYFSTSRTNK